MGAALMTRPEPCVRWSCNWARIALRTHAVNSAALALCFAGYA